MKSLLKLLYRFHRETLLDLAVQDFYKDIPKSISEPAITLLAEKRPKIDQLLLYQVHLLQRRAARSPREADMLFGMITSIKLLMHSISGIKGVTAEAEDTKPASKAEEDRRLKEQLDNALKGADKFKTAKKK